MATSTIISNPSRMLIVLSGLLLTLVQSLDISYCSPDNTGDANGANYWQFQSNGHCQDTCKYQYAYAILQGNNCWCSNYAPYDQVDNSNCNSQCPGFPSEQCGNQAQALYGYYHLAIRPSGTLTPAAPSTTSQAPPDTITVPVTVTNLRTPTTYVSTITSATSSRTTAMTRGTPTPIIIVSTVLGSIATVTVTPTLPPDVPQTATASPTSAPADPFWSSTPKVAGTFTAVAIVIVLLIAGIGFFFWRRHRSSDSVAIRSVSDHGEENKAAAVFGDKRTSKPVLGGRGGSNERHSGPNTPMSMSRRASQPLVHDQRLNPNALYAMGQDNGSHVSIGSFQDDQDYSRPVQPRSLRVHNPDA